MTHTSNYPYYLPSYYSGFYGARVASEDANRYNRYFQPTRYWAITKQPVITLDDRAAAAHKTKYFYAAVIEIFLLVILSA